MSEKIKIYLNKDEWYPVFDIKKKPRWKSDVESEITEEELEHIEKVFKEFNEVQERLIKLYEKKEGIR